MATISFNVAFDEMMKDPEFKKEYENLAPSAAKLANIKLKTQEKRKCPSSTQKVLKELDNGEYETFEDFNAYKKAMSEIFTS